MDWNERIRREYQKFVEKMQSVLHRTSPIYQPHVVWDRLAAEGNLDLINTLRYVENHTPGFGTVVITKEGFSEDDDTHNAVLDWLHEHNINTLNPGMLIHRMEQALHHQVDC